MLLYFLLGIAVLGTQPWYVQMGQCQVVSVVSGWLEGPYTTMHNPFIALIMSQNIVYDGCASDGVAPDLLSRLQAAAIAYGKEIGEPLVVTSTRRTLRRQAELMARFSLAQLEGMYCRNGYPSYIREIAALGEPYDSACVYEVLCHRSEGYISKHLSGQAADISAELKNIEAARKCLLDAGLTVLDETEMGVRCLHVALPGPASEIVRE